MSTAATAVLIKPSIVITPATASDAPLAPNRWLSLADGPFGIVAQYTDLTPFSQASRGARKKFYRNEIVQYRHQPTCVRLYGELSDLSWLTSAETLIREMNQRKAAMMASTQNHAWTLLGAWEIRLALAANPNVENLSAAVNFIEEMRDYYVNELFQWLSELNPSPLEIRDANGKFRDSLETFSTSEKAAKIRSWLQNHGRHLHVPQQELIRYYKQSPPELLEITSLTSATLNKLLGTNSGNPDFFLAVIRSPRFREILPENLVRLFGHMLSSSFPNFVLIDLLITGERAAEIKNDRGLHTSVNMFYEKHPKKCKELVLSRLSGETLLRVLRYSIEGAYENQALFRDLMQVMSPAAFEEAVFHACAHPDKTSTQKFFEAVAQDPRFCLVKAGTVARGVFAMVKGQLPTVSGAFQTTKSLVVIGGLTASAINGYGAIAMISDSPVSAFVLGFLSTTYPTIVARNTDIRSDWNQLKNKLLSIRKLWNNFATIGKFIFS